MSAIADASGDVSGVWPLWVWALLATAGFMALAFREVHRALDADPEPDGLDTLDGAVKCNLRCNYPGTVARVERDDLGGQLVRVCHGHSDEGDMKGWWVA